MFEKLNQIVQESQQVFLASELNESSVNDAMHEATGVVVDVLKNQLEHGNAFDLMSYFNGNQPNYQVLTKLMVNKYANRLNQYFNMSIADSKILSTQVIPVVLGKFINQTATDKREESGVIALLNWLSGNTVDFKNLFLKMNLVAVA